MINKGSKTYPKIMWFWSCSIPNLQSREFSQSALENLPYRRCFLSENFGSHSKEGVYVIGGSGPERPTSNRVRRTSTHRVRM